MIRSVIKCDRGNSFIELALAAPLLTTLIIGTVDLSMAYSAQLALEQAAQRTVERVQRNSYKVEHALALEAEAEEAAGHGANATLEAWLECSGNGSKLDFVTGSCPSSAPYARYVEMEIEKPFNPIFGRFFPNADSSGNVTLRAIAGIRVQ